MADGLQVWDGSGTTMFDATTQVVKFLGTITIGWSPSGANYTGDARSGSLSDGRFTQYGGHVPFFARIDGGYANDYSDAQWSFSGNTLTWTYPLADPKYVTLNGTTYPAARPVQTIIYGIR